MNMIQLILVNNVTDQNWIALLKDILSAISAIVITIVSLIGITTWKDQIKRKTEYELAQKYLRATYKVREAINWVRNPFETAGEKAEAIKEEKIEGDIYRDNKKRARVEAAVYQNRWKKVDEAVLEFNLISLEAEALWGGDVNKNNHHLLQCTSKLGLTISRYIDAIYHENSYSPEFEQERSEIMYSIPDGSAEDKFNAEITSSVKQIEDFVKPRLSF